MSGSIQVVAIDRGKSPNEFGAGSCKPGHDPLQDRNVGGAFGHAFQHVYRGIVADVLGASVGPIAVDVVSLVRGDFKLQLW